ncbi:MAG TPA: sigma 54 modulation/S30EA ribosomal C-terminal domain-containing protein [Acidimicrobiales bacterium]|nr:sigma 54 modulation/S30EA ribosomal C-terminal domain-containing protein [Acidimicrobiales bacterium]
MPDGRVAWVDIATGEATVRRRSRQYAARLADVEPSARHVGARVHFDIRREEGTEAAVDVRLLSGTHSGRHHHDFGTLAGAHRPDTKGPAPFAHPHPEYGRALAGHPLQVAGAWARRVAAGDIDEAFALYAPNARVHLDGDSLRGRHIRSRLEALPVFATGQAATVHGEDGTAVARWAAQSAKEPALEARTRVEHGLITQQWIGPTGLQMATSTLPTGSGEVTFISQTHGAVSAEAVEYARQRIGSLVKRIEDEPLLFARLKLSMAPDPARPRRAIAQASLDVNGQVLRAHVAAHEMHEAVDLLHQRLADKIEHRAQHIDALRRHTPGAHAPGEWRHGDLPTDRPDYFDRPVAERRLVRHKAFVVSKMSTEEAAFDMEQLDYDFYLFRDALSGEDSVLERDDGGLRIQHLHPAGSMPASYPPDVTVNNRTAPRLTVDDAIEHLDESGERFVFFASEQTGRGNVLYRRYDGHYGLITLE